MIVPTNRLAIVVAALAVIVAVMFSAGVASIVAYLGLIAIAGAVFADVRLSRASANIEITRDVPTRLEQLVASTALYSVRNASAVSVRVHVSPADDARLVLEPATFEVDLAAGDVASVSVLQTARVRGPIEMRRVDFALRSRIGLIERRRRVDLRLSVDVYPDLGVARGSGVAARDRLLEAGIRRLRAAGVGSEFERLREYAAGDAFRSIDWKASARRGSIIVAQHEIERSQQVIFALDCGRLMATQQHGRSKLDYALEAALSLARIATLADDRAGAFAFDVRDRAWMKPGRGAAHYRQIVRATFALQPNNVESDYERAAVSLRAKMTKRALIVLFTDAFETARLDETIAAFRLLAQRHVVVCAFVNDGALETVLDSIIETDHDAFSAAVALELSNDRRRELGRLRAAGLDTIDVPAPALSAATIEAYVALKTSGRL